MTAETLASDRRAGTIERELREERHRLLTAERRVAQLTSAVMLGGYVTAVLG